MAKKPTPAQPPVAALDEAMKADQAAFREAFPQLAAAIDAWTEKSPGTQPAAIRVSARVEGFRRAGIEHSKAPVDHQLDLVDGLKPEQLEQLFAEPNLVVQLV